MGAISDALRTNAPIGVSTRQPAQPWQVIYGNQRLGGTIIFYSTTGGNKDYLNLVIVWAHHQVEAIDAIYLDGKKVYFDGNLGSNWGNANSNKYYDDSGVSYNFGGHVYVEHRYGNPGQLIRDATGNPAPTNWISGLTANDPTWTSTCNAFGCAYTYIKLTYSTTVFPNGQPEIKASIRGKNDILDPRTGQTGYSTNWALCVADYLSNPDWGFRCDFASEISQDQLIAAANVSDEAVPTSSGDDEYRYTCNGAFTTDAGPGDILQSMLEAGSGRISYSGGLWNIYPGAWLGPTLSFTQDDILGSMVWKPKLQQRNKVNGVKGTFICPVYPYQSVGNAYGGDFYDGHNAQTDIFSGEWQPTDYPPYYLSPTRGYAEDTYLIEDQNFRYWLDLRQQFVISVSTAQRLAKIALLRNRQQQAVTLQMKMSAYQAKALDVIQVSHPTPQWANKYFEVQSLTFNIKAGDSTGSPAMTLSTSLSLQETDPSVYAWSLNDDETVRGNPSPYLSSSGEALPPTNLVLESGADTAVVGLDGVTTPRIKATWTAPADLTVTDIEVQFQQIGWGSWLEMPYVDSEETLTYCFPVVSQQSYNVRIRSVKPNGAVSDWVGVGPHLVSTTLSVITSSGINPNSPANQDNNATIDSVVENGAATVRIYGPGGDGSAFEQTVGITQTQYPGAHITGLEFSTEYYVVFDTVSESYMAYTVYRQALSDNYVFVGAVLTCDETGNGGEAGGGNPTPGGGRLPLRAGSVTSTNMVIDSLLESSGTTAAIRIYESGAAPGTPGEGFLDNGGYIVLPSFSQGGFDVGTNYWFNYDYNENTYQSYTDRNAWLVDQSTKAFIPVGYVTTARLFTFIDLAGGGQLAIATGQAAGDQYSIPLPPGFDFSRSLLWTTAGHGIDPTGQTQGVQSTGAPNGLLHSAMTHRDSSNFTVTTNWIMLSWTSGANVTASTIGSGTYLQCSTAAGDLLCFLLGNYADGGTIQTPPGFVFTEFMGLAGMASTNGLGDGMHGVYECSIRADHTVHATYSDDEGHSWTGTANVFGLFWTNSTAYQAVTGGGSATFNLSGGKQVCFIAGNVPNGSSFGVPPAFASYQVFAVGAMSSHGNAGDNVAHGFSACDFNGTVFSGGYQDGSGNSWPGSGNFFAITTT